MQNTFDIPTSYLIAKLCLFKLLKVTLSKSIILILHTPDLANIFTTCEPTPPTPKIITDAFYNLLNLSSPKNLIILASCSFFKFL